MRQVSADSGEEKHGHIYHGSEWAFDHLLGGYRRGLDWVLRHQPLTLAVLLGGLPLALGTGTGSEQRRPLGITIVGGLIVSQMLTLFTTPVVYIYIDRLRLWLASIRTKARTQARPLVVSRPAQSQQADSKSR